MPIFILMIFLSLPNNRPGDIKTQEIRTTIETDEPKWLFDPDLGDGFSFPLKGTYNAGILFYAGKNYSVQVKSENKEDQFIEWFILPNNFTYCQVHTMAKGRVIGIEHDSLGFYYRIRHAFIENAKRCELDITYGPVLISNLQPGQLIERQNPIGELAGKKLCVRVNKTEKSPLFFNPPTWYAKEYRNTTFPKTEENIIVVRKKDYSLFHYRKGELNSRFDICLGQDPQGHKIQQGDNKTPEGEYRISEMEKGPFVGGTGPWLGERWMHFSYPNRYDAWLGYKNGIITRDQFLAMEKADKSGKTANNYTKLGGRIGIHGWNGRFVANGTQDLTWGCVCMQNEDIVQLYEQIKLGVKVMIIP